MSPLLPYVPPSKGLLRSLQAEVQALAHQRLAQHLRWYQLQHGLDDEQVAQQMNACAAVVGIRAHKDDAVFAPISEAKIARFKDGKTKPQRLTLDQMTAFCEAELNAPPSQFWTDMDDVLAGLHDARRFRKERTPKKLVALTKCWLLCELCTPYFMMALHLTPLQAAPVVLVRGRIVMFDGPSIWLEGGKAIFRGMQGLHFDLFVNGFATLTPQNLNLFLRDEERRQIVVYLDVDAGPFEQDSTTEPYLVVKQATINLPTELGISLAPVFRFPRNVKSRQDYIANLTDSNYYVREGRAWGASFYSVGRSEWDSIRLGKQTSEEVRNYSRDIEPDILSLGLLASSPDRSEDARVKSASDFWSTVSRLKYVLTQSEKIAHG